MSREPDGDEPLAIYEMGQREPVAYVTPEPGDWPDWSPAGLADEEAKAREGQPAPTHQSRWSAWTKPRFSYLELIGIYVVVSTLVDLVWHRG